MQQHRPGKGLHSSDRRNPLTTERIRISGGEPGGEIEIAGDTVLRRLRQNPWNQVEPELHRIAGLHERLGVIPWSRVAADGPWVLLSHPRVRVISYPHEWCGEMLLDAALSHCALLAAIAPHGMALKDAHPWNVLFDATRPKFVDIGSIVPAATLAGLDYLKAAPQDEAGPACEVFRVMFVPFFLVPLSFHHAGLGAGARAVLWRYPLNGAARDPRLADYLSGIRPPQLKLAARGIAAALRTTMRFRSIARNLPRTGALSALAERLAALVAGLTPPPLESGYTGYYPQKGEDQGFDDRSGWNAKQRNVIAALDHSGIETVLDAACNTGWYSRAAAHLGKRVTAVDTDGACISALYRAARLAGEDIVPLVADVAAPAPDRERQGGGLLMISAERRLRSDLVLALGILHHLVLGSGVPLAEALGRLSALAGKRLVVEFVGLDDEKVRAEPGFFPAHARRPGEFGHFTLDAARNCLADLGWQAELHASHPGTRTLLVCSRVRA